MRQPILRLKGLSVAFGGLLALRDVSFDVYPGEIVGLIGPNGAGKTTLFHAVSGYLWPRSGEVWFDGHRVTGRPPYLLARMGIARTFQIVRPFPQLSVLENVMVGAFLAEGRRAGARRAALEILEWTGLADRAYAAARELTLAGRKRLEIARALALRPRLLLLDEVVAGLNPSEADATVRLILAIRERGITIVAVEHIMRVIMQISDRIVVLHHGEKIAEGPPGEVASNPLVVEAYLGTQESGAGKGAASRAAGG
ncbi:ABC transporter ATP-binding protein [Carboxydichorda subterranea]